MPTVINPTPGRVVWFYPNIHFLGVRPDVGQPLGARIARVRNDRLVNLAIDDANGSPFNATSVTLLQEGDEFPTDGRSYCTWMPYQLGQAAKHEAKDKWVDVPKPEFTDVTPIVTGALYDLMAYLTTRPQRIVLSGSDEAGPAVEALKAFFELRGIDDAGDPLVPEWKLHCKRRPGVLQNLINTVPVSENPRIEGSRNTLT